MRESEKNEIVVVDKEMNVSSKDYGFPFYRQGLIYGGIAGVLMSIFALLISGIASEGSPGVDFLKYLILAVAVWMVIKSYKTHLPRGKVFKEGLRIGVYTSFVAAITMLVINVIISLIGVETGVQEKFGMVADSLGNVLVINGLMVFETLVFGVIATFVSVQFMKDKSSTDE